MSDVMERTFASIPRLLSSTLLGGGRGGQEPRKSLPSQSFQNLLKTVDSVQGCSEQAAVVQRALSQIKQQLEQPDASVSTWSESFPEIIFCSILGYDVSFCHIYAIKLAAQGQGRQKRIGYLAATLLLDTSCEITIMIMGTLQRDLNSSNMVDNLMALNAAAELVSMEHIPLMLPAVVKLLRHRQAMVRAKAVYCMHAFFRRAPSLMQSSVSEVKSMLGDKDPGVLMAVVTMVESLVEQSGEEFVALGMALVNVLQQIRAYKFPTLFSYHGIPLPWLQIKLLKILACLGPLDENIASPLIPLLSHILRDTVGKEMMSLAILEESLMTIASLARPAGNQRKVERDSEGFKRKDMQLDTAESPEEGGACGTVIHDTEQGKAVMGVAREWPENNRQKMSKLRPVVEEASRCVASFLGSDLPNLRYIGVKALTQLVSVNAELAVLHKEMVVNCLNDPDLIVRRQTLSLLHHMAIEDNFKAICTTMLKHVQQGDLSNEANVIDMVVDISNRLNSDPEWYLQTIFPLLSWRLDPVRLCSIRDSMLSFFSKTAQDNQWPQFPELLFTMMAENIIKSEGKSDPSVQFSLYVLRFVPLPVCTNFSQEKFLAACMLLLTCDNTAVDVKDQVVLCVQSLLLRGCLGNGVVSAWTRSLLGKCGQATPCQYHFRVSELLRLASLDTDWCFLSSQKSPEDMDFSLSFLDSYCKTVDNGQPFLKIAGSAEGPEADHHLFLQWQGDVPPVSVKSEESPSSVPSHDSSPLYAGASADAKSCGEERVPSASVLQTVPGVKQRWSKHGFNNNADEKKSLTMSETSDDVAEDRQRPAATQEEKGEELADALFQGLSPPSSAMQSLPSPAKASAASVSYKSFTSSGFDSSSSQNSTGTSGQDMLMAFSLDQDSSFLTTMTTSQDAVMLSGSELQSHTIRKEVADSHLSPFPPPPSNSWKALHSSHVDGQTGVTENPETDQQFMSSVPAKCLLSKTESVSNLSISDDSLENASSYCIANSPTRQTLHSQSSLCEERDTGDGETDETVLSAFLEAQMMESVESPTAEDSVDEGRKNLYSGFEILAQCSDNQREVATDADHPEINCCEPLQERQ